MDEDVLVVGSGAGGATIARELAMNGKSVTVLEKGRYHKLGTERRALGFYPGFFWNFVPGEISGEGTEIIRTIMVGGSTMVTLGNGVRSLQEELRVLGVNLEDEFLEVESELSVKSLPVNMMGERTKSLMNAASEIGYSVKPMPKFVDFSRCRECGMCVTGCLYGAKWTAQRFLAEARKSGAKIMTETSVEKVIHSNGEVRGVRVRGSSGQFDIESKNVILAAGGIGTPIILQKSGLDSAGDSLFADLFVNTFGIVDKGRMEEEIGMGTIIDQFHESDGFILSPILDTKVHMLLYLPLHKKLRAYKRHRTMGLMTKIKDSSSGSVEPNGTVHKPVTKDDRRKLEKGDRISREILLQAGVEENSLYTTGVRGAHPGGTAGIGRVISKDQETEISRLFVSDASALPEAPGAPPVLTIVALSKRLSKLLLSEYI